MDTGSDTSIIKPNTLPNKLISLQNPMIYNSLAGKSQVTHKIITSIPKELIKNGTIEWKVFPLKSGKYDAIMGMNALIPFQSELNIHEGYLKIFSKFIIPFQSIDIPKEIAEANHLEPITDVKEEIFKKISTNQLNVEEKTRLKDLLVRNKDLFFNEGDNLTSSPMKLNMR